MAAVREVQIQLADEPGMLGHICAILGDAGINIEGFAAWLATAHVLLSDVEQAVQVLERHGYNYRVVDVLQLDVPDEPRSLAEITKALGNAGINIEYAYSVTSRTLGAASFVLATANAEAAETILD